MVLKSKQDKNKVSESDKLHALIKAMSKSEKRHFKLFYSKGNKDSEKNYLKLYEVLSEMKDFDKSKLLHALEEQAIKVIHLASDKNYLYHLILESLKNFHASKTTRMKIIQFLSYTELLFEKGLVLQAKEQIVKAKKLAIDRSVLSYLNEILRWERKLKGQITSTKDLNQVYEEYQNAMNAIQEFNEYDFLYRHSEIARINITLNQSPENLAASEAIINNSLMSQTEPNSPFSQIRYEQIKASYFFSNNNWKAEYQCNKKILSIMEEIPKFKEEYPFEYISIFSRILILTKKVSFEEYRLTLNRFLDFAQTTKRDKQKVKARIYSIASSTEMVRIINEGVFEEGIELVEKVIEVMNQFEEYIEDSIKINNYYKFAYIHLALGNYSKALSFLNFLLGNFEERYRPDIFAIAKLLLLVVHYELGNHQLLPYLVNANSRFVRKNRKLHLFEKHLFSFFKKFKTVHFSSSLVHLEKELQAKLISDFQKPKEKYILNYFDFLLWLESRINKISFMDAKKKAKKN